MSHTGRISAQIGHKARSGSPVVFAITFDMATTALQASYRIVSWQSASSDIGQTLAEHGFSRQQGSVYLGDETLDPVRCVLAVQALARRHVWFRPSVRDIRMLRIEDNNDLMPALLGA